MIRRYGSLLRALLMLADGVVAVIVLIAVYTARFLWDGTPAKVLFTPQWLPVVIYPVAWVLLLYLEGQYRLRAHWSLRTEAAGIIRVTVWMALISYAALFLSNMDDASRIYTLILFPIQGAVTLATRGLLRAAFTYIRSQGRNVRYLLVIGTNPMALDFARRLEQHSVLGLRVTGTIGEHPPEPGMSRWPHLGTMEDIDRVLHTSVVDEVAICLPASETPMVEAIARVCQEEGKLVRIPLDVPAVEASRRFVEELDGIPVLSFLRGPDQVLGLAVKRMVDIVVSALALIVLSPLIAAIAVTIRVREGGPILFRQERIGMHGRRFTLYKFRTMVPDAEERLEDVLPHNHVRGPAFKILDDPRVTRTGRWLRQTSLDELPQLWNVLTGTMSLVGPRPAPAREVDEYDLWHRRRLSMKPGMTGLWQVSERQGTDFDRRASLDLDYIDRWSIWLDLQIVARTLPAVFSRSGR